MTVPHDLITCSADLGVLALALGAGALTVCVLMVEDDDFVRAAVSGHLRRLGHPVLEARDGEEAIKLIKNPPRRFSVLVTDFHMPGHHHGCDVAAHMAAHHPHVHVFVATGQPKAVGPACQAGVPLTVIEKPYSLRTLLDHIGHLIEA